MTRQPDHLVETVAGGTKRVRLIVVDPNEPRWTPVNGNVPRTRGECPDYRPCDRIHCREHLWRVDSSDRPGRPSLSKVPRLGKKPTSGRGGWTVSVKGHMGNERSTTLEPLWLTNPAAPSCALDLAQAAAGKGMTNGEIAEALGRHRTLTARAWKLALRELIARGVTYEMFMALVDPEHRLDEQSRRVLRERIGGILRSP
jgi:hypothetical protein